MFKRISADLFGTAQSGGTDPLMVVVSLGTIAAAAAAVALVS